MDTRGLACSVLWVGVVACALSCYRTYTGIYRIQGEPISDSWRLERTIYDAIRDLGFNRAREGVFLKPSDELPEPPHRFDGDDAVVTIAVSKDSLSITVRDLSNREETEFIRELKQRIERALQEHYGPKDFKFRRQPEFVP